MIRVSCRLHDCVHHNAPQEKTSHPDACDCAHEHKEMYMENFTCPLYKREWTNSNTSIESLAARFKNRGMAGRRVLK